jgi:PHD/YefM family antitoxin component YafN of YafNO toxin-antitoxin module
MPDWYVQRNSEGSPYPFQVRLGGCEYSLTEAEFNTFAMTVYDVYLAEKPVCIESEGYQDLVIASTPKYEELKSLLGLKASPARRF